MKSRHDQTESLPAGDAADSAPVNPGDVPLPILSSVTAWHEAGHAVVALSLGRPVQKVTILPDDLRLGRCEFQKATFRPSEDWLEREMLISLAGAAAEAMHTGQYDWGGAFEDLKIVRKLARQRAGEKQAERLERRMLSKVEHLLSQDSVLRAVELIAAELLRCGTISGRAARHFFDQATKRR